MSLSQKPGTGDLSEALRRLRNAIHVICGPEYIDGPIDYLRGETDRIRTAKGKAFSPHMRTVLIELARREGYAIRQEVFDA